MKRTKFTEEQIAFALRQAETETRVEEVCRQLGISQATFFNWKKKFGGLGISELRCFRQLEEENTQLVADLSLDKLMLQEVLKKNFTVSAEKGIGHVSPRGLLGFDSPGMRYTAIAKIHMVLQSTRT